MYKTHSISLWRGWKIHFSCPFHDYQSNSHQKIACREVQNGPQPMFQVCRSQWAIFWGLSIFLAWSWHVDSKTARKNHTMTDHKIRIIFLMSSLNTKKNICMEKYAHCFSPNAQKLRLFSQVFHFHLKFVWISSSLKEKNSYRVIITRWCHLL